MLGLHPATRNNVIGRLHAGYQVEVDQLLNGRKEQFNAFGRYKIGKYKIKLDHFIFTFSDVTGNASLLQPTNGISEFSSYVIKLLVYYSI